MNFNRKSIWKITASVSVVLMLLTLGVSAASACQAGGSPAYCDQNSLSHGNCDLKNHGDGTFTLPANKIPGCDGGCDKASCTGNCCDNCIENPEQANCEGNCCEDCAEVCGEACTGDCCENCAEECDQADCGEQTCDQTDCNSDSEQTCDPTGCTGDSGQTSCNK